MGVCLDMLSGNQQALNLEAAKKTVSGASDLSDFIQAELQCHLEWNSDYVI